VKSALTATTVILLETSEKLSTVNFVTVTATSIQMLLETAIERLVNVSNVSTTQMDHIAINVCLDILAIHLLCRMESAKLVRVIQEELFRPPMEFQSAIRSQATASAKKMSLERTVTSVRMDSGTLQVAKDVRIVIVIQLAPTTHRVIHTAVNVSANLASLDFVATSARLTSMDFHLKDV